MKRTEAVIDGEAWVGISGEKPEAYELRLREHVHFLQHRELELKRSKEIFRVKRERLESRLVDARSQLAAGTGALEDVASLKAEIAKASEDEIEIGTHLAGISEQLAARSRTLEGVEREKLVKRQEDESEPLRQRAAEHLAEFALRVLSVTDPLREIEQLAARLRGAYPLATQIPQMTIEQLSAAIERAVPEDHPLAEQIRAGLRRTGINGLVGVLLEAAPFQVGRAGELWERLISLHVKP